MLLRQAAPVDSASPRALACQRARLSLLHTYRDDRIGLLVYLASQLARAEPSRFLSN
ncbi:hypothetical protein [Plantactinospora sp. BB1]|uniref:hypothetical protein n=1 Tax=Plantactinospora sp. BB1 TaxID=2071627 RepID=UPI00131ED89B|nr:hypothetical protein [Plantactinospora sp. BB1]